ncbi:MAG: NAD-dependent deacylase [Synergistaceae bacterium]|jgi:NAD-dependent deacetylase|nr:NAD-dependent deacylase [Synergistaceae bacterium]
MGAKKNDAELKKIEEIASKMTDHGNRTVIFTGAGMSTDSGLPDFRSKDGLWKNVDPMELATASAMRDDYDTFHGFYSHRFEQMRDAHPNAGHRILADWEARGIVDCIITQNIDGLHAAAGSEKIFELHGSVGKVRCMECGVPATQEEFIARTPCGICGGKLRPGVVLFGEGLPEAAMDLSWAASEEAGVFLVLGSSLNVSPANQFPVIARRAGALVAICNRDATHMDSIAYYRTHEGISYFLAELDALISHPKSSQEA